MANAVRKRIYFEGSVQGVGFRYRAYHAAQHYGAGGFVRNCPDGSVLMEIEAPEAVIDQVILAIERGRYVEITRMRVQSLPLKGSSSFFIAD